MNTFHIFNVKNKSFANFKKYTTNNEQKNQLCIGSHLTLIFHSIIFSLKLQSYNEVEDLTYEFYLLRN